MNIAFFLSNLFSRCKRLIYLVYHLFIQKPIYFISYNNKQNKFRCEGLLFNSTINLSGHGHEIIIEKGVRINNTRILIKGNNNRLIIHRDVIFKEGGRIKLEDENNVIEIGQRSDFVDCFFAVSDYNSRIIVGEECMSSAKVIIRNSDVHSILNEENKRINRAKDVLIGNRVWIGYGANILKGTHIGDDSIIGTQSVVTGLEIPHGTIVGGNPAKIIRSGIHWCRERLR